MVKVKAFLFTFSIVLIVATILAFGILLYHTASRSMDRFTEFAMVDRMVGIESSLTRTINRLLPLSGVSITKQDGTVTFSETLNASNASTFNATMYSLQSFANRTVNKGTLSPLLFLDVNALTQNLSFIIEPHNITYTHHPYGGNAIYFSAPKSAVQRYTIALKTEENVSSCVCQGSTTSSDLLINVSIDDLDNWDIEAVGGQCCPSQSSLYSYDRGLLMLHTYLGYDDTVSVTLLDQLNTPLISISYVRGNLTIENINSKQPAGKALLVTTSVAIQPALGFPTIKSLVPYLYLSLPPFNTTLTKRLEIP